MFTSLPGSSRSQGGEPGLAVGGCLGCRSSSGGTGLSRSVPAKVAISALAVGA